MFSILLAIIYLSFISLGLPDSLLGSAWPSIYKEINVPVSWSGIIFAIISFGTIVSSLQSDRLTKRFGAGKITAVSVLMTAIALMGFSYSRSFISLCLFAIPYGLGAGSVDAALNNYVALHYKSRHMSWLHCMWGVGASVGPYIMSHAIVQYSSWNMGYKIIGIIQIVLSLIILFSLPLWKNSNQQGNTEYKTPSVKEVFSYSGAKQMILTFFCYCAFEQTVGLWASTYLVLCRGISDALASAYAALFFIGITVGRALNGFLTFKLNDKALIRMGQGIILLGIILIVLPYQWTVIGALVLLGLGCAPIYPCIIHSTPFLFGVEHSQSVIGIEMAGAYIGTLLIPPLFGVLSSWLGIKTWPWFLLLLMSVEIISYHSLLKLKS